MIESVLFDLDGTLIDTWDLYIEAYKKTLEPHVGRCLSQADLIALRPTSELRLLRLTVEAAQAAAVHEQFIQRYRALHTRHFGGVYPGVAEALDELRNRGYRLGLVTGKSRAAWAVTGAAVQLGHFEVVVTDDDVAEAKPHPEGLRLALQTLGLSADQAVYIGDSLGDAQAAEAAGVRFGAALWPKAAAEIEPFLQILKEYQPWGIFTNPKAVLDALCHKT